MNTLLSLDIWGGPCSFLGAMFFDLWGMVERMGGGKGAWIGIYNEKIA